MPISCKVYNFHIQESNLNLSSSFQIPGFSALRSHGTHSGSGIFSTDVTDASGGVIIFVKQGLSFSELSASSLSSLDPYSDYVEVNISPNDSSSLLFLNAYAPPIRSSTKDSTTNFFSLSILPSYVEAEAVEFFALPLPLPQKKDRFQLPLPLPHPRLGLDFLKKYQITIDLNQLKVNIADTVLTEKHIPDLKRD